MTEMLETQEATVDESFDDTGFLEGQDGLEESSTQGAEQEATAEPSHEPGEGSGEESSAESAKEAEASDPAGGKPQPRGRSPERASWKSPIWAKRSPFPAPRHRSLPKKA